MTLPRLAAITKYQRENPPVHVMVAAYLGAGEKSSARAEQSGGPSLFDMFPQTQGGAQLPKRPGRGPNPMEGHHGG